MGKREQKKNRTFENYPLPKALITLEMPLEHENKSIFSTTLEENYLSEEYHTLTEYFRNFWTPLQEQHYQMCRSALQTASAGLFHFHRKI